MGVDWQELEDVLATGKKDGGRHVDLGIPFFKGDKAFGSRDSIVRL